MLEIAAFTIMYGVALLWLLRPSLIAEDFHRKLGKVGFPQGKHGPNDYLVIRIIGGAIVIFLTIALISRLL